ncbi:unnamed protein product [Alopecurus aequalis]
MSKRSGLLCVVCVLVVALLAGDHQLVSAAARIGDEFLSQDPILMLSHAGRNELSGASAAAPAFTRKQEEVPVLNEDAFLSPSDKYAGEEELMFVRDESALDLDRSADVEELADGEEGEENSLLGGQGAAIAEGSNGSSEEHGSGGDVECPECGKRFRNHKSMFGHLRSHPYRRYKGATPPSTKLKQPLPPAVNNGDRPVARSYSQRDPNLNTFEILAAYVMLTLKHRDRRIAGEQSVKKEPDVPGEDDSVVSKEGDSVAQGDKHGSLAAALAGDDTVGRSEHSSSIAKMGGDDHQVHQGSSSVVVEAPTKRRRTKKSKEGKEARRKEKGVASASKGRRPYICKHCQAEFPTHQALGGHMAAHNKDRRVQVQNEQAATAALEAHHHRQGSGVGVKEEEQRRHNGMSASTNELLLERYTRLFNQGRQPRQEETAGGYKRQHRLFGVDL